MNMQFAPFHRTHRHREGTDTYVIYQANIGGCGNRNDAVASGAPVIAVEHNGNFYPRRPELDEAWGTVKLSSLQALEAQWHMRETRAVDYDSFAGAAIHHGINPWFDLLKDTTLPSIEDRKRNPYGGFPESAFHDGVTRRVLQLRRAGLLAAMIRLGALAEDNSVSGNATTALKSATAALEAVDRMWQRAFAKRQPLPPGTLRWFRDAQLWWPPHIYSDPSNSDEVNTADDWL